MRQLLSFFIGLVLGAVVAAAIVTLFAPTSGAELVERIKRGYADTLEEARKASQQRREELEAELRTRRLSHPTR